MDTSNYIALAALCTSLIQLVYTLWRSRSNLKVSFNFNGEYNACTIGNDPEGHTTTCATISCFFENNSTNPISINYVEIVSKNHHIRSRLEPQFAGHIFRNLAPDTDTHFYERFVETASFPIKLDSLISVHYYIQFRFMPVDKTIDYILINTNRKKIKIKDPTTLSKLQEFLQPPIATDS